MTEINSNPNPILVALDFSEDSKAALVWACKFADCTGARLVLLHVIHDLASHPGFYHPKGSDHLEPMQDVAESMMDEFLAQFRTEHPDLRPLDTVSLKFVPGLPPSRIVEVAGLLNASLIALGSRGQTGLPHRLLGVVAERVAELSTIPVVIVKSETHGTLGKKERKRMDKRRKKDRKILKDILGIVRKTGEKDDIDG
jgi:nucleotide-binding universal stress UspA family protein